eukprot:TRINITY_DN9988_c0_g1_i1.p1 TRINITY_DN9988_c0_g1~~TRINITY_DN9988_c0_g1_i1.p1  ORF type:complete len:191 (+),score=3.41 TRINITY_DN9988_c0_g1_i1:108-680(+)
MNALGIQSAFQVLAVIATVLGACIVFIASGSNFFYAFVYVVSFALLYKYVCKDVLCPPGYKSKGVMRLAESGNLEELKRALAKGLNINTRDEHSCTLLHWAAMTGQLEICEHLVKHGVDINAVNDFNSTALHLAASRDRLDIARLLIEYGANKNIIDSSHKTALEMAVSNPMKILFQIPLFQSRTQVHTV